MILRLSEIWLNKFERFRISRVEFVNNNQSTQGFSLMHLSWWELDDSLSSWDFEYDALRYEALVPLSWLTYDVSPWYWEKMIRLVCKRALEWRLYSAKETYNFSFMNHLRRESRQNPPNRHDSLRLSDSSYDAYVSFAEYSLHSRALLQKRRIILRSLLIVATPKVSHMTHLCLFHDSFNMCVPPELATHKRSNIHVSFIGLFCKRDL